MKYLETNLFFTKEPKIESLSTDSKHIFLLFLNEFNPLNNEQITQKLMFINSISDISVIHYFYNNDLHKKYNLMPIIRADEMLSMYDLINNQNNLIDLTNNQSNLQSVIYTKVFIFLNFITKEKKYLYIKYKDIDQNLHIILNPIIESGFSFIHSFDIDDINSIKAEINDFITHKKYFDDNQVTINTRNYYPNDIQLAMDSILNDYNVNTKIFKHIHNIINAGFDDLKKIELLNNHQDYINSYCDKINNNSDNLEDNIKTNLTFLSNGRLLDKDIDDLVTLSLYERDFRKEFLSLKEYSNNLISSYILN